MNVAVGTSGYAYKPWKGKFYPEDLPNDQMLGYYAERFKTVEINNTFYRMPSSELLERWRDQVPDKFSFVLKASRRITHIGRLKTDSVRDPVAFLFEKSEALGAKRGPMLFQLPPTMRADQERLEAFLEMIPSGQRVAMEFRNPTWFEDPVYEALKKKNVALCYSDGEMKQDPPFVSTADWGYLRLRAVEYSDDDLTEWAERVNRQAWKDAYVFFKHEEGATGPALAERFESLLDRSKGEG